MNSNYKVVEVYLSYGENSISKIDIIKSEFGVDDVVKGVFRDLDIKEFKDDDDLYYGIYSIDEKKDIGVIGYGDESIILVFGEKNEWYNKVDLFAYPTSCENLPNILLEAMAAGLPIACSDRGLQSQVD